jgi:hypothetical protein
MIEVNQRRPKVLLLTSSIVCRCWSSGVMSIHSIFGLGRANPSPWCFGWIYESMECYMILSWIEFGCLELCINSIDNHRHDHNFIWKKKPDEPPRKFGCPTTSSYGWLGPNHIMPRVVHFVREALNSLSHKVVWIWTISPPNRFVRYNTASFSNMLFRLHQRKLSHSRT